MSGSTKIEWTDYSFNPWWGCSRVSPGCKNCYADRDAQRYGHQVWRRHGPRRMLSDANWQRPLKWNREAREAGVPAKVFCASMADVFEDHPDVAGPRERLWRLIEDTPFLRWQILTKRPENTARMVPWDGAWPDHVWLGVSVENQRYAAERIPLLAATGAAVKFLSCEPLLGPVDLDPWLQADCTACNGTGEFYATPSTSWPCSCNGGHDWPLVDWVIAGGESGPRARATGYGWLRSLREQCAAVSVPFFAKQLGAVLGREYGAGPKGGDFWQFPEEIRVREFPVDPVPNCRACNDSGFVMANGGGFGVTEAECREPGCRALEEMNA